MLSEKGHFYEAETKQISYHVAQRVLNGFLEEVADLPSTGFGRILPTPPCTVSAATFSHVPSGSWRQGDCTPNTPPGVLLVSRVSREQGCCQVTCHQVMAAAPSPRECGSFLSHVWMGPEGCWRVRSPGSRPSMTSNQSYNLGHVATPTGAWASSVKYKSCTRLSLKAVRKKSVIH